MSDDPTSDFINSDPYSQALIAVAAQSSAETAMLLRLTAMLAGKIGVTLSEFTDMVQEIADTTDTTSVVFKSFVEGAAHPSTRLSVIQGGKAD